MAENGQDSQGPESVQHIASNPKEGDKQSLLLKLAERTVLQAEALAQEITDHARQESEAEGVKIVAKYTDQAKSEAQQTIESAERKSQTLLSEAATGALAESEKTLKKTRSEGEKILSKAQSDSEKILSKAQSESEDNLDKAQAEGQAVLAKSRQEAQLIISASQTRAESTESNARLKAEFVIRQTTQNVSEGIRSAVLEICNNLLPAVEEFGKEAPKSLKADQTDGATGVETKMLENAASNETSESDSTPDSVHSDSNSHSSDRSSGGKAKASAKRSIAA